MTFGDGKDKGLDALGLANRILEIGIAARRSLDIDEISWAIVEPILEHLRASYAAIWLVPPSEGAALHEAGMFPDGVTVSRKHAEPRRAGLVAQVILGGRPLCVDDHGGTSDGGCTGGATRAQMAVPLQVAGQAIGAVDVHSSQVGRFGPAELALLQAVATPVARAIEIARLSQQERRRMRQLTVLNRLSRVVTSTVELDELLRRTVEAIREQLDYFLVAAGLVDDERPTVVLRAASLRGPIDIPVGHVQALGEGVVGEVVQTGRSLLVSDVRSHDNYRPVHADIRCEMCCPLKVGDRVFGFLDAEDSEPFGFDRSDLLLFETLAEHISQAIENARNVERISELREDLSNMVVHDMRNPLTVIRTSLWMLQAERADLSDRQRAALNQRYIGSAQRACDEIVGLIDGLLDLQKIESGSMRLHPQEASVEPLIRGLIRGLGVLAESRRIALGYRAEADLPVARIDHGLITRVLQNLTSNALKFTPAGGRVSVEVRRAPDQALREHLPGTDAGLLFDVRDTGPGIPTEDRERVFEKFATVESRKEGRKYSTGLGLAFCKQAVKAHGGTIWVESNAGQGSVFRVLLPIPAAGDSRG